ncbi:MAG: hypothetical protein KFW09_00115 [Oscillospiraceae bacterium]|nr:hypothetical protein [Oscillospiraceae bacterium]
MSLTSFLSGKSESDKEFQRIIKEIQPKKIDFKTLSGKQSFSSELIIKVPNKLDKPINATVVGIAFDYLARFQIAQVILENKEDAHRKIVAMRFFSRYESSIEKNIFRKIEKKFSEGLEYIKVFISSNNEVDKNLIKYVYFFAKLEQCWRRMLPDDIMDILKTPPSDIESDLINLSNDFRISFIKAVVTSKSKVLFNPEFGKCSQRVGGADADICVDNVLYDFKTTKKFGYVGKDIQQLISYYLFSEINIDTCDMNSSFINSSTMESYELNRIAIYLVRFGEINYMDMNYLCMKLKVKCMEDLINHLNLNIY